MNDQSNESVADVQSKLRSAKSLCLDLLLPQVEVLKICDELEPKYRDRVYNPMIVVWMFVTQVLSADHNCQQAVTRFSAWRVIRVLAKVSGKTTSYKGKQTGDTSMLRTILDRLLPCRILLADRYYASFWLLAAGEMRGIDLVARAHHLRKVDFRRGLKQGYLDQLVAYHKPERPTWMSKAEYAKYPSMILVRHLKYKVEQKGFRTREIKLATALLDADIYTADELASLYGRRWSVELHVRILKTQMQMEHLRCQSPQMVRKEIHCHMIGYILVRAAMLATVLRFHLHLCQLSFTGAMQAIKEFASSLRQGSQRQEGQWESLLEIISELIVCNRPGRQEKRELKRRQKNYKLMTCPRNPNRNCCITAA